MTRRRFFHLTGRVQRAGGWPLRNAQIRVYDRDPMFDDLIAFCAARSEGEFEVSFARESFNQEWGEDEDLPQLYLHIIETDPAQLKPISAYRIELPALAFADGHESVGDLTLTPAMAQDELPRLYWPSEWMGHCRVRLDEEALAHVLAEVVPRLESLLGATGTLTRGFTIRITEALKPTLKEALCQAHGLAEVPDEWLEKGEVGQEHGFSFLDPSTGTLWLDREGIERSGLDRAKQAVGQALVEHWLFERFPRRREKLRAWYATLNSLRLSRETLSHPTLDRAQLQALSRVWLPLFNQSEYVAYVDQKYLSGRAFAFSNRPLERLQLGWIVGGAIGTVLVAGMALLAVRKLGPEKSAPPSADTPSTSSAPQRDPESTDWLQTLTTFMEHRSKMTWKNVYERLAEERERTVGGRAEHRATPVAPLDEKEFDELVRPLIAEAVARFKAAQAP